MEGSRKVNDWGWGPLLSTFLTIIPKGADLSRAQMVWGGIVRGLGPYTHSLKNYPFQEELDHYNDPVQGPAMRTTAKKGERGFFWQSQTLRKKGKGRKF